MKNTLEIIEKKNEIQIMEKHIIVEKIAISDIRQGDYYLPDLALPAEKEKRVDI